MKRLHSLFTAALFFFFIFSSVFLQRSLVLSLLLYGWESRTLTADLEMRQIQASGNKCYMSMVWLAKKTKRTSMHDNIFQELLLPKLSSSASYHGSAMSAWYAAKGTADGSRRTGRPRKSWRDNIKEWTGKSLPSLLLRKRLSEYPNDAWGSPVLVLRTVDNFEIGWAVN